MFIRGVCCSARSGVTLPPSGPSENLPVCLQQQLGYQDEEERSLNSLDDSPAFPLLSSSSSSSRSRSRGNALDRDRQLLEDLLSFYLTAPSSSSSSSSLSRHAGGGGGGTAAAGFPSSSSSSSSFFSDLDFPLNYGENYVSQVAQLKKQQQQQQEEKKKQQAEYDALSGLDGE